MQPRIGLLLVRHRFTPRTWLAGVVQDPAVDTADPSDELELERAAVHRISASHRAHVDASRRYATGLADEAVFLSEEGPRETEAEAGDEDGEAAAEAASARAASARAVLAFKRVRELERAGEALAFGRITDSEETNYIGRMSVIEGDDVLMIDWRAAAAAPFYRATPLDPLDVRHRRHLHYTDGELTDYSDEVFDPDVVAEGLQLRGEAALLTALAERSDGRMRSVVATIQAEQDAIIRASAKGPLLVQGGPGTGKTVVALHRAAYLLYADRAALAETGVLIVGPSPEFLTYISNVLPSLGESGVISVTADQLHPGVAKRPDTSDEVATLKGDIRMAAFLAEAVRLRQRQPKKALDAWYGSRRLRVDLEDLRRFYAEAQRRTTHNAGAGLFRRRILEVLTAELYAPGFEDRGDIVEELSSSREIRLFMERHWPVLSPEQALNDLLGSTALLAAAGRIAGVADDELELMAAERSDEAELWRRKWEYADIPLLDELLWLLGDEAEALDVEAEMEHIIADEDDVFTLAEAAGDEDDEDDDEDEDSELARDEVESFDAWREGDEEGWQ